jgi:cysteine-rich repeat protein
MDSTPRSIVVALILGSISCRPNPFIEISMWPVCEGVDTDEICREGSGGMGGTWFSTGDESSSSGSSSTGTWGSGSSTDGSAGSTGPAAMCGNGVVEGEEECDDANEVDDDRCAVNCTKNRWVFASEALHNTGDLNGLKGADNLCAQYALQSGRADDSWKTFIAWLSDADNDVRDRLYHGRGRYVRTDNVVVVHDVEQFFSGMPEAPINVDELGNQVGGGAITGTNPDGTRAPGTHCDNWTLDSAFDVSAQNEEIKKISAWAAIFFAPTLIGTVYGMNFEAMPELRWVFGYPFALALMLLVSLTLYAIFKRRGWL